MCPGGSANPSTASLNRTTTLSALMSALLTLTSALDSRELRTAIDAARVNQEELQKPECDDLERAVDAADAMNEGVDKPREMCLDMEHYGQLAAFSLERTKRLGPRGGAAVTAWAVARAAAWAVRAARARLRC